MMRWFFVLLTAVLLLGGTLALSSSIAEAQPTGRPAGARQPTRVEVKEKDASKSSPHGDRMENKPSSKQPGMALLFWGFAAATIGGALFVITRRNLIAAVMGMVGSFLGISAVYMMLYAHFLSVVQMLVYAGAIMVLFVFVIMILNRPEDEPVAPSGRAGQAIGGIAIAYLIYRLIMLLVNVKPPANAGDAPAQVALPTYPGVLQAERVDWGSTKAVGMDLFGPGLFPFEAISILLLVAVVGAIAIAKPMHNDDHSEQGGESS